MIYQVKYGKNWLRQGRLASSPRVYYHPGTAEAAWKNFERRFPDQSGKGEVLTIENGKVINRVSTKPLPIPSV